MGEPEMDRIAELIADSLDATDAPDRQAGIRERVRGLCREFPLYS
jgi:glycine/serine hydroxymethyltransferase